MISTTKLRSLLLDRRDVESATAIRQHIEGGPSLPVSQKKKVIRIVVRIIIIVIIIVLRIVTVIITIKIEKK